MGTASLTLYARREATTDDVAISHGLGPKLHPPAPGKTEAQLIAAGYFGKLDVVLYHDAECSHLAARYAWHSSSKPTPRSSTVMYNCFRYKLVWTKDKLQYQGVHMPLPVHAAA